MLFLTRDARNYPWFEDWTLGLSLLIGEATTKIIKKRRQIPSEIVCEI